MADLRWLRWTVQTSTHTISLMNAMTR